MRAFRFLHGSTWDLYVIIVGDVIINLLCRLKVCGEKQLGAIALGQSLTCTCIM